MTEIGEELDDRWQGLEMHPGDEGVWRALRLSVDGPIACYAAIRNLDGKRCVIFESPIVDAPHVRLKFQAEGISVLEHRDFGDGRYRVAASAEQDTYRPIFRVVAIDLLETIGNQPTVAAGWTRLQQRIEAWQACLRARKRGLTREEQVGLYGELVCLRMIATAVGLTSALAAWKGPLRGLHDFVFANHAFEVKTATGNDPRIMIGSLDQLEKRGIPLAILRPRLQSRHGGPTLAGLVDLVRLEISTDCPTMIDRFEELMLRAGYLVVDAGDYIDHFEVSTVHVYELLKGFPILSRSTVDPAVVEAEYHLDEGRLVSFRRDAERLGELLDRGSG